MNLMKANIYDKEGNDAGEVDLWDEFTTPFRPDVIRKAISVSQANRRQPYGADPMAGKKHAVESWGPGRGVSRVPRLTQGRRAAFMPGSVGGRRAHPPKAEKDWSEKINKKEKDLAFRSALAATADPERVRERGHRFEDDISLPVVVDDDVEEVVRTQELKSILETLGLGDDLKRAREGRNIRAGKGTMRGRKYRTPSSILLVTTQPDRVGRAASNLLGVDVTTPEQLNVERLAPGGDAGRLTVFTKSALNELEASR